MDKATVLGLLIGFGGILIGNAAEGGHINSLLQLTAFLIVVSGTVGAVVVSNTGHDIRLGIELFKKAFKHEPEDFEQKIREIVDYAKIAKKESLLSLDPKLGQVSDPFLQNVLRSVIDGIDRNFVRDVFENQLDVEEERLMAGAKIWADAGGFSPTIGIIGAVLGLIHVMGNLSDTSKLGAGIAVAFVATVYGVSFANLLYLPISNKIKRNVLEKIHFKRMMLEGGLLVGSEINPLIIEQKLKSFILEKTK